MSKRRKVSFGPDGYKWNHEKTSLENWKEMKEYYAQKGIDIGEMPELTEKDFLELGRVLKDLRIEG